MGKNYLYISDSPDGYMNLAVDEWFIDHMNEEDLMLYFYINKNAVIIGRNQNPWKECALDNMAKDSVQLVRRISGGGAVYHDAGNLNFSFIAGAQCYDKDKQHRFILEAVQDMGIPCSFSGRNDLLAEGKKFSGNAYCKRGSIRQHHGTLLIRSDLGRLQSYLNVDPRKIRSKGVDSVRSRVCNLSDFLPELTVEQMLHSLPQTYKKVYGEYDIFTPDEKTRAEFEEYRKKHASEEWRLGSTPQFEYRIENRFSFGGVEILLNAEKGRVSTVKVYTDANDYDFASRLEELLLFRPFGSEALSEPLLNCPDPAFEELGRYIQSLKL